LKIVLKQSQFEAFLYVSFVNNFVISFVNEQYYSTLRVVSEDAIRFIINHFYSLKMIHIAFFGGLKPLFCLPVCFMIHHIIFFLYLRESFNHFS